VLDWSESWPVHQAKLLQMTKRGLDAAATGILLTTSFQEAWITAVTRATQRLGAIRRKSMLG